MTGAVRVVRILEWAWTAVVLVAVATLAVSWTAGWQLRSVDTGSMSPAIPAGSLAVVTPAGDVGVGDVIAFADPTDRSITVVHRVVASIPSKSGEYLRTQGDANRTPDPLLIPVTAVEGRVASHVPIAGTLARRLRTPAGIALLVSVPLALAGLGAALERRARTCPGHHGAPVDATGARDDVVATTAMPSHRM